MDKENKKQDDLLLIAMGVTKKLNGKGDIELTDMCDKCEGKGKKKNLKCSKCEGSGIVSII